MPSIILQHPSAPVKLVDPRDPPFLPDDGDRYALPQPGVSEPIHLQALRGSLPAETCGGCGQPNALHYDTSGLHFLGCAGVPARKRINAMVSRPLRDLTVWGDAHPGVSLAILDALRTACGIEVAAFMDERQPDEALNLSRRLSEIAVIALRAEDAKWNR